MSGNIPFEIQNEIMKKLPGNSLIRFRLVSKPWKSLIESSEFIADYTITYTQTQHLLVRYNDRIDSETKYVLILDDDTFPKQKFVATVPDSVKQIKDSKLVGTSHGLLCLYGDKVAIIWNPLIRKSIAISVPNVLYNTYETLLGFGVCSHTNDPKIVKIIYPLHYQKTESVICIPGKVEVFTLSSRVWRSPFSNFPLESIGFTWCQVVMDGFIYWVAFDKFGPGGEFKSLIISFDIKSEEFGEICFPDCLAYQPPAGLPISKLRESLVVLAFNMEIDIANPVYDVWRMGHGVMKSFTKLFTINPSNSISKIALGFRKTGEPIMEMQYYIKDYYRMKAELFVFEPESEHINHIGIYGIGFSFFVSSYTETLLLLDQPESTIYNDIN